MDEGTILRRGQYTDAHTHYIQLLLNFTKAGAKYLDYYMKRLFKISKSIILLSGQSNLERIFVIYT